MRLTHKIALVRILRKGNEGMKNRKKVVIALLLVCALCLGIGYAAVTDKLFVNGTVSVSPFAYNVYFANATCVNSGVNVSIADEDDKADHMGHNDKLTISVDNTVLRVAGDKVIVSVDIKNDNTDYNAVVTFNDTTTSTEPGLYKVTCAWAEGSTGTIANESTNTVNITIELLKVPTKTVENDEFTITFDVEGTK